MKTKTMKEQAIKVIFITATVLLGALISQSLNAQIGTTNKEKMESLQSWAGKWKGEGWSIDESRQRNSFTVEEHIQSKLGGRVIQAEGIGTGTDGKVGFRSYGVFYYSNENKRYEVKSFTEDGNMSLSTAEINEEGQFIWGFEVPAGSVRYTITLTGDTWKEKGEFVMGSGQTFPIMEMSLTRVK